MGPGGAWAGAAPALLYVPVGLAYCEHGDLAVPKTTRGGTAWQRGLPFQATCHGTSTG